MPSSSRCSARSPTCRCEWYPAPLIAATVLATGLLAMAGLILTNLPGSWVPPAQLLCGVGCVLQARRWLSRPRVLLVLSRCSGQAWVDGEPVALSVGWRCGLPQLRWRSDGRLHCRVFAPGQLPPAVVSELRQWPGASMHSRTRPPVAP